MSFDVPYLSDAEIETEANVLLKSFEAKYGKIMTAATPLDEIIENHLGLGFEITDLGHPAILGQLDIKQNLIRINAILDPHHDHRKEGRYNYTLAHEAGHQVLHRPYAEALMDAPSLFGNEKDDREIILCRREDQKAPIEIQADKFSSCLLLPREKVRREFQSYFGKPTIEIEKMVFGLRGNREFFIQCFHPSHIPSDDEIIHHGCKEFAELFRVSRQAMVIRLKNIGLLSNISQNEMFYN